VLDNVAFGLRVRGLKPSLRRERALEALDLVQMTEYAHRHPGELSGGQQQRVAIARAVVVGPACLLLDEPLSNLDARLRHQMRGEIRRICRTTGLTTLYVTHDQKEALSIADRIAIMNRGRAVQVGSPHELYTRPQSAFAAEFLGQFNLINGRIASRGDELEGRVELRVETSFGIVQVQARGDDVARSGRVVLGIRPEQVRLWGDGEGVPDGIQRFDARVIESSYLGDSSEHWLELGDERIRASCTPPRLDQPERLTLALPAGELSLFSE
jgi:ABC-type Fe3+/spermidine/putrescine transport system ATPase subunit